MRPEAEPEPHRHRPARSRSSEIINKGREIVGAVAAGVKLAEVVLPYLRPLVSAAAL